MSKAAFILGTPISNTHDRTRTLHSKYTLIMQVGQQNNSHVMKVPENFIQPGIDNETYNEGAWPAPISDAFTKDPFFAEAEKWAGIDRSLRGKSPTPVKPRISPPRDCEVAFDADGKATDPVEPSTLRHHPIAPLVSKPELANARNYLENNFYYIVCPKS
jgi:hypothetical protein